MLGWDILNYLKMCRANLRATSSTLLHVMSLNAFHIPYYL